ncbi:MAG: ATP-binding protein, partial [Cyanobacteria bacterium J06626_18]
MEVAAQGVYPESIANDVSPERLERYFEYKNGHYQVRRSLREMLIIAPHDLTKNADFSKMDLVTCRNVLIYMQPQLQQQVLRLLHFSLAARGTLFLGSSETLGNLAEEFIPVEQRWKIFQKRRDTSLSLMPLTRQAVFTPLKASIRSKTRQQQTDRLLSEVFDLCLAERQITCLLVSHDNQMLRVFHNAAQLLNYPVGAANLEVTEIVHPALKLPLSTALHRTKRDQQLVLYTGIKLDRDGEETTVKMRVGPDKSNPANDQMIVVFEVEAFPNPPIAALRFDVDAEAAQQITELEYELQQTRENLQVTIEELETANEEQQATNEELLASNEELQSTNEELQSVNEELYTVNSEYQSKIQELTQLNNDIDNLLRSTDIGVVFLDTNLNIRKFTPAATRDINIKEAGVGRPLTDLTNSLNCPNLVDILQQVSQPKEPYEQEVEIDSSNSYALMRIHPYTQNGDESSGIVLTFVSIVELKRVQDQLRQANEILENLYETSPVGLCLQDEDLKYLRVNRALAEINGASIKAHLGKTLRDISPNLANQVEPLLRRVIETDEPVYNFEIRIATPTSSDLERYWSASYYPVNFLRDGRGVGAVVVEITERVQAEAALRDSRTKLIEAQQLAKIGSWELKFQAGLELDTAQAEWSEELLDIYRLEPQQSPPTFAEFIQYHAPEDQDDLRASLKLLISNGVPFSIDVELPCSEGESDCLNIIGQAIRNSDGQITKLYGTVMDITERKRIEKELVRKNEALEEAIAVAQAADSANQAKSEFLANMSYEIRTPMNSILMSSQLLRQTELEIRQQQILQTLQSNSEKLLNIINDVLDLSKLEARELQLENRLFSVSELFQSLSSSFAPQIQIKNLALDFEIASDVPEQLRGDDFRMQQILSNLIDNAIKFTQAGRISVRAARESRPPSEYVHLRFDVRDTGIGIDADSIEKLFQPFTQADTLITRQFGGTGLGLTICRRIVEMMNGEIGVESSLEQGSTFWFRLSFEPAGDSEPPTAFQSAFTNADQSSISAESTLKFLIAEDYEDNRELLLLLLEDLGYEADSVTNGREFLDQVSTQSYNIVLMDCQMPVLDGYEATRQFRQQEEDGSHTVIIGLTAHAMEGDRQKCLDAGMDD